MNPSLYCGYLMLYLEKNWNEGTDLVMMTFECECGNRTSIFATGDRDEQGREFIEIEDDERLTFIVGETGVLFRCSFCSYTYRLDRMNNEIK